MLKTFARKTARSLFLPLRNLGISPPERVFRHLYATGPFEVRLPDGQMLTLMSWGNRVENELTWRGWVGHEPDTMRRWVSLLPRDGDILDVGANTGTFAFIAKAMAPDASVFAFEPLQRIADRVEQNVSVSGLEVTVVRAAVSDVTGELPIYDPGGSNVYSASLDSNFLSCEKESYNVPVVTIDGFCAEHGLSPRLIKMDVEGVEAKALLGSRDTLLRFGCPVVCEWSGGSDAHAEAVAMLRDCGYVAMDIATLDAVDLGSGRGYEERNVLLVPEASLGQLEPFA